MKTGRKDENKIISRQLLIFYIYILYQQLSANSINLHTFFPSSYLSTNQDLIDQS